MTSFKEFQKNIKALGGVWKSNDVYFTQFMKGYYADYRPYYPDSSDNDISISLYSSFLKQKEKHITIYIGNHKGGNLKIIQVSNYSDIPDILKYK